MGFLSPPSKSHPAPPPRLQKVAPEPQSTSSANLRAWSSGPTVVDLDEEAEQYEDGPNDLSNATFYPEAVQVPSTTATLEQRVMKNILSPNEVEMGNHVSPNDTGEVDTFDAYLTRWTRLSEQEYGHI